VDGIAYTTPARNQELPRLCGSCWAHAATGALSDRFKIAFRASVPDIILAPQVLLNLSPLFSPHPGTCESGNPNVAYEFIYQHGITDESCAPYEGTMMATYGEHLNASMRMCRTCTWDGSCHFTMAGARYKVLEHGKVQGMRAIQAEIWARGPVACAIQTGGTSFNTYDGRPEVMESLNHTDATNHVIALVGWGETAEGIPYWIGRNSFGTQWGENGFFKMRRGRNDFDVETWCAWAVPAVPTAPIAPMPSVEVELPVASKLTATTAVAHPALSTPGSSRSEVLVPWQIKAWSVCIGVLSLLGFYGSYSLGYRRGVHAPETLADVSAAFYIRA